jgi:hypothetical protein
VQGIQRHGTDSGRSDFLGMFFSPCGGDATLVSPTLANATSLMALVMFTANFQERPLAL